MLPPRMLSMIERAKRSGCFRGRPFPPMTMCACSVSFLAMRFPETGSDMAPVLSAGSPAGRSLRCFSTMSQMRSWSTAPAAATTMRDAT